jgi:hypothetical protein
MLSFGIHTTVSRSLLGIVAVSLAPFPSYCLSKLQSIDATIDEMRIEVEKGDEFSGSVLQAAALQSIQGSG